MEFQLSLVLLLFFFGIIFPSTHSLRFELQSGQTKCIAEDIKSNAMTVGKYSIVNPNEGQPLPHNHKITVRVTSPNATPYHQADEVESGQFAFTAAEAGDYISCFTGDERKPEATMTVDFDWRTGVHAKDWPTIAKQSQVVMMELELKKLYDSVTAIHEEMLYLREREEEMQDLNKATNSKMAWLSLLSLLVCLSVAGWQLWHLKTFFEKKKII